MIPKDWAAFPMWTAPLEAMTSEAIELICDADRRPRQPMDSLIVRLHKLPLSGGED